MAEVNGYEKAKAVVDKLKKEKELKMQEEKIEKQTALVTLDSLKGSNIGMKNITAEDVRPPMMFLVQNIKDKSELCDNSGKECPDGRYFLKGVNEILESVSASIIWVKKDHYQKEGSIWDGVRMYKAIAVRLSDMMPFAINFQKSSVNALTDLFTAKTSQGYPLFAFKVEIKVTMATNKAGIQFFKSVVNVRGLIDDPAKLAKLQSLAVQFDMRDVDIEPEEESVESVKTVQTFDPSVDQMPDTEDTTNYPSEVSDTDDVPF